MKHFNLNFYKSQVDDLHKLISDLEARISALPRGTLLVNSNKGKQRVFLKKNGLHDKQKEYISNSRLEEVKPIAQRMFYEILLRELLFEAGATQAFHNSLLKFKNLSVLLMSLPEPIRNLVELPEDPFEQPKPNNEEFIRKWKEQKFRGNPLPFTNAIYSIKGIRLRSKSEEVICSRLEYYGIPFHYEMPFSYTDPRTMAKWEIYPDFTILNPRTLQVFYWEHGGMMDKGKYVNDFQSKLIIYGKAGHTIGKDVIVTVENEECPLKTELIDLIIKNSLL